MASRLDPASAKNPEGRGGFAQALEQRVVAWVYSVLDDSVAVVFAPPGPAPLAERSVCLFLMALAPSESTRGANAPALQFSVRYLVTTSGPVLSRCHDDLFELAFSAIERPEFEAELEPLRADGWQAFGVAPQPAFAIRLPLRRARVRPAAPPVRVPLVLAAAGLLPLRGSVLGPGDVAVANARVEIAGMGMAVTTDPQGRFRFAGVPVGRVLRLRVLARGATQEFETEAVADVRGPLQLRMNFS